MTADEVQRPPAEVRYAEELAVLAERDNAQRPPGWGLSLRAARTFIVGDGAAISRKFVGDVALIERALVTLATGRGLMLIGDPGTAKSLLSELIAAAVSGTSTLTIQGSAATTEDQIRYGWNYALLLAEGPSEASLIPAPLLTAMREGRLVRFEEITRCAPEVQDTLLSVLSDRVLAIPELGRAGQVFARPGFNVIATANTRDRGVNDMSAALKRRFNFETVFPIRDFDVELALVVSEVAALLRGSGVPADPEPELTAALVTLFRELRDGRVEDGRAVDAPRATMSTAEAITVGHAIGVRGWYLREQPGDAADLIDALAGTAAKDNTDDVVKIRRYLDGLSGRSGDVWKRLHAERHRLPEG